jgi:hypothetical protein
LTADGGGTLAAQQRSAQLLVSTLMSCFFSYQKQSFFAAVDVALQTPDEGGVPLGILHSVR